MKTLQLFAVSILISLFGFSNIASAFDVTGSTWFSSDEATVSTKTISSTSAGEDIDVMTAIVDLKLVLLLSESDVAYDANVCNVSDVDPESGENPPSGNIAWSCSEYIFDQPASVGCKYCDRGSGLALDLPTGNLIEEIEFSACKTNTNPGGGGPPP